MAVNIKNKKASYTYFLTDEFTAGFGVVRVRNQIHSSGQGQHHRILLPIRQRESFGFTTCTLLNTPTLATCLKTLAASGNLLLQRTELKKLEKKVKDVGVTLVPTLIFVSTSGYAKLKFSVAKGKKLHDKRQSLKDKDISRDIERMMN